MIIYYHVDSFDFNTPNMYTSEYGLKPIIGSCGNKSHGVASWKQDQRESQQSGWFINMLIASWLLDQSSWIDS